MYKKWSDDQFVWTFFRRCCGIFTQPPRLAAAEEKRRETMWIHCRCSDYLLLNADTGVYVCPRHFNVHRCGERWLLLRKWLPQFRTSTVACPRAAVSRVDEGDCCLHTGRTLESVVFARTDHLTTPWELHAAVYGRPPRPEESSGRKTYCLRVPGSSRRRTASDKGADRQRRMEAVVSRAVSVFADDAKRRSYNDALLERARHRAKKKRRRGGGGGRGGGRGRLHRGSFPSPSKDDDDDDDNLLSVGSITGGIKSMLEAHVRVACDRLRSHLPDALHFDSVAFCLVTKVTTGVRSEGRTLIPSLPFRCLRPLPSERNLQSIFGVPLKGYSRACNAIHRAMSHEPFQNVIWPIQRTIVFPTPPPPLPRQTTTTTTGNYDNDHDEEEEE